MSDWRADDVARVGVGPAGRPRNPAAPGYAGVRSTSIGARTTSHGPAWGRLDGAPRKPGKGGSKEAETFESDPVRGTFPPPGQGRAPAGTECCVGSGDGNTKRTQGACGPCMEPRKRIFEEADVIVKAEGSTPGLKARSFPGAPPGSETMARLQGGHPGTWEALLSVQGSRESERLVVPRKPGNSPHGDPAEGRGRLVSEPRRERCREHRSPQASQRNKTG